MILPGLTFLILIKYVPMAGSVIAFQNFSLRKGIWGSPWVGLENFRKLMNYDDFHRVFRNTLILGALKTTLEVAVIATVVSTVIGTLGAIGMHSMSTGMASALINVSYLPMTTPDIVTGVSLMLMFLFAKVPLGKWTMIMAHIAFDIPYVLFSVMPKLRQMNPNLYEAALDLGATPFTALWEIVIPQIVPGIISGFALAVTLSLDDYFISTYTKPAMFDTISTYVVNATKGSQTTIKTALWALSTVIFAVVVLIVIGMNVRALQKEGGSHAKE